VNTNEVNVYDPRTDTWRQLRPMATKRGLLKVAVVGDRLFAIGGRADTGEFLRTVERYDPRRDTWQTVAPMHTGRGNPAVAVADGRTFVVGGASPEGALRTTEVYDPEADRWRQLDVLLPIGRASFSAARLSGDRGHDSDRGDEGRGDEGRGDEAIIAFGGFQGTVGQPEASAVVESLRVGRRR
jgi:N-acetylneuraminic acid mutarotase